MNQRVLRSITEQLGGDVETMRTLIKKQAPELNFMIQELRKTNEQVEFLREQSGHINALMRQRKIDFEVLEHLLQSENSQVDARKLVKQSLKFQEMKMGILVSYSSFLNYYLLLRVEQEESEEVQADVSSHPVALKLTQLKTIIEGIETIDQKT
mmetsp:Transcript_5223/g.8834  ORF Transcript_5223/g.8834 Transcript_5223/m.8834 type:complete len:154 (+) Transcript_5223:443-904(+)